ncbi:Gfo/Idh/MocA family protein [Membranihabitans marinus]|uniref:Gfo/Idh/MocA family protein n=1 Tax=Membranihabitans marinus TaxID=1227546 RepID=UPI001F472C0D|nr:Gfo/Idh/MocA family oxidoreductase [Membranihabitans marinus]
MSRKIRMGMVGGGPGAFIGNVHRMAARLDGEIDLVCGAFSSSPEKSKQAGKELYLPEDRVYGSFQEMIEKESALPADVRMDCVSIVTPNHLHFLPAKLALENGFHVICDKPMTRTLEEALELEELTEKSGLIFALTHTYTGYPMVKQARDMVSAGTIGDVRKIYVEYPQGWLTEKVEDTDSKQAGWRVDPSKSGIAGAMGDIGTHAENLAEYITGQKISELCADLNTVVKSRVLDDDGAVLLRFDGGASGILTASQVAAGEENSLAIRIYGTKAGLEWHQMEPNSLVVKWLNKPMEIYRTGVGALSEGATAHTRVPAGHPEGYLEAFANLYRNFAKTIQARLAGQEPDPQYLDFPTVSDGVRGMKFLYKVVESGKSDVKWTSFNN